MTFFIGQYKKFRGYKLNYAEAHPNGKSLILKLSYPIDSTMFIIFECINYHTDKNLHDKNNNNSNSKDNRTIYRNSMRDIY